MMVLLSAFVVLGLTACGGTVENEDRAFGVEDLPEWLRTMTTDEDWEESFSSLTPEELELFFTEGLGAMDEPPVPEDAPEGSQSTIVAPGQDDCDGSLVMNENGLECIALEDLDDDLREIIENELNN